MRPAIPGLLRRTFTLDNAFSNGAWGAIYIGVDVVIQVLLRAVFGLTWPWLVAFGVGVLFVLGGVGAAKRDSRRRHPIATRPGTPEMIARAIAEYEAAKSERVKALPPISEPRTAAVAISSEVGPIQPAIPDVVIDAAHYQLANDRLLFPGLHVTNAGDKPVSLSFRVWQRLSAPVGLKASGGDVVTALPLVPSADSDLFDPLNLAAGTGIKRSAAFEWPNYGDDAKAAIDGAIGSNHEIEVYDHNSKQRFRFSGRWPLEYAKNPW